MFRDDLLVDPGLERPLLLLLAAGVRFGALRVLADAFNENWDLVEERVPDGGPDIPDIAGLLEPALCELERVCDTDCADPDNRLRVRLDEIGRYVEQLRSLGDELDLLEALGSDGAVKIPSFKVANVGRRTDFDDIEAVRTAIAAAHTLIEGARKQVIESCADHLGAALRRFTLQAARERRHTGQLEFHDLLVLARTLLRDPVRGPEVRARVHERYRRILLDEFQDTDPIQAELAVRIAAVDPASASGDVGWEQVEVAPGHLFFVGDPKQSIYRFRRADISTFMAAAERFGSRDGGRVGLTANFRTVAPIIEWVNDTFARLMHEPAGDDLPVASQPAYAPLVAVRPAPAGGPALLVLGRGAHPGDALADELRAAEATEVAATVARAIDEGWSVDAGEGATRPARLGDIAILVPARTSLPFLEDALDAAGVPFRAEASSLVYAGRAVRDLLMVARAVDDPTNHLHVVSTLRTPLFGCGDDDLFRFKSERGGRWNYLADQPGTVPDEDPVKTGLDYLRSLHEAKNWLAPSEILDRIARDRRAFELGFALGRPRDQWRRLRFVIDQARAWSDATGGNLRQYVQWVDLQTAEGDRVAEAILPETDDDAVRIMTIHSAKGLEFPITVVSGMSTAPKGGFAPAEVVFPASGPPGYKFGKDVRTEAFEAFKPIDEQMGLHERIRLLYVACTRARDHLVVSVHRRERTKAPLPAARTNAELLLDGMGDADAGADVAGGPGVLRTPVTPAPEPLMPFADWAAERADALERASRPTTVSATALTDEGAPDVEEEPDPGLDKRPRDLDLPPWLKGRYGTSVGRAVHGVLQTIDLAGGGDLDAAVAAQCEAEAVRDRESDVSRLVGFALTSSSVKEAAGGRHWREVYVCAPIGDRLLEGYIDLLYRDRTGLVVVDYKTSADSDPAELARRVEGYRFQGASYALCARTTTGEAVGRVIFVFLTPSGAVELELPDLEAAMGEVGELLSR